MQNRIIFLLISLVMAGTISAQHQIGLKSGEIISNADIYGIKSPVVTYKKGGSLHDIMLEKVEWVEKEDAQKMMPDSNFNFTKPYVEPRVYSIKGNFGNYFIDSLTASRLTEFQLYQLGLKDGKNHFHAPINTLLGVLSVPLFTTAIVPIGTAASCFISPNLDHWNVPPYLQNKPSYVLAFKKRARMKRAGNAAKAFGITTATIIVLFIGALLYGGPAGQLL